MQSSPHLDNYYYCLSSDALNPVRVVVDSKNHSTFMHLGRVGVRVMDLRRGQDFDGEP